MTDALPQAVISQLEDPFAQLTGNLAGTRRLQFEVAQSTTLSPHLQRLQLAAAELDGFTYAPGQDVMLLVAAPGAGGAPADRGRRAASAPYRRAHGAGRAGRLQDDGQLARPQPLHLVV